MKEYIKSLLKKPSPTNWILICIILFLIGFIMFYWRVYEIPMKKGLDKKNNASFELLSPDIAFMQVDDFLKIQKTLTVTYTDLKPPLINLFKNTKGKYGLYFEDLNTGAWMGINEKERFIPASLLKIPTLVGVLKKVEKGEISLDDKIKLNKEDLDLRSGTLGYKGEGYEITIRELLKTMIRESDNTAFFTLNRRVLTQIEIIEARLAMGLPPSQDKITLLSPKEYIVIFRSLYYSSYLRRPFSELALSIMLETEFNSEIRAGVPKEIKVSHKVGMFQNGGYYHDCGIVYAPKENYLLCVMSSNSTMEEANNIISNASKIIYDYVSKK